MWNFNQFEFYKMCYENIIYNNTQVHNTDLKFCSTCLYRSAYLWISPGILTHTFSHTNYRSDAQSQLDDLARHFHEPPNYEVLLLLQTITRSTAHIIRSHTHTHAKLSKWHHRYTKQNSWCHSLYKYLTILLQHLDHVNEVIRDHNQSAMNDLTIAWNTSDNICPIQISLVN